MKNFSFLIIAFISTTLFTSSVFATTGKKSCDDMQSSAKAAMEDRTKSYQDIYDEGMPDPKDSRELISNCIGAIQDMGNSFDMGLGAAIPSMDDIIKGVCQEVNSKIDEALDQAISLAKDKIGDITAKVNFDINTDPTSVIKDLTDKLKI